MESGSKYRVRIHMGSAVSRDCALCSSGNVLVEVGYISVHLFDRSFSSGFKPTSGGDYELDNPFHGIWCLKTSERQIMGLRGRSQKTTSFTHGVALDRQAETPQTEAVCLGVL